MSTGSASAAAQNLRALRRAAALSQEELAERCGISERTIRTLEAGRAQRPHRDTLLALAEALLMPHAARDAFVASWRQPSLRLDELITGQAPEEAMLAEFVRQRSLLTELSLHDYVRIDGTRRWLDSTVRRTFEVVGEGLDRFLWLRGYPPQLIDPESFDVVDCRNVEVGSVVDIPAWSARAWEGLFRRTLAVGEIYSFQWTYDWRSARVDGPAGSFDCEALTALPRTIRTMSIEVAFTPGCLPLRVWEVSQESIAGPQHKVRPLQVSPFGIVQLRLEPASAGTHGIRWEWDDPA